MHDRDLKLDFVKGVLVVVMVVYHTLNYFSTAEPMLYGYLRFINGAFIFVSGYIVATYYDRVWRSDKWQASKRLFSRGVKLLAIFTVLNLLISAAGITNYQNGGLELAQYLDSPAAIFGTGNEKSTAFKILVPIAYVLLLSPLYFLAGACRSTLIAATLIAAFACSYLWPEAPNAFFVLVGLTGTALGLFVRVETLAAIRSRLLIALAIALLSLVMNRLSSNVLTYAAGVAVVLKLLYDFAQHLDLERPLWQLMALLGQYSLVCYLVQIMTLHVLHVLLAKPRWPLGHELLLVASTVTVLLVALCLSLKYLRRRYRLMDRTYRMLFA